MTRRRELWFSAPHAVEVRRSAEPRALESGEVRAEALASGVSQGTELLLYRGEGPTPFDPSLDAPGTPTYPRRYGYAWVGEVAESRANLAIGTRVFALVPHGDEHVLPAGQCRSLPATIPPERATLAANLETAVTVIWDAELSLGDRITILGGGVVGLLSAWLARRAGAGLVRLVEPSARRRRAALALGVDDALAPDEDDPKMDADVVVEATGDPASLDRAIGHAAREATVVVASFYGERTSPVALGSGFHRRRIALKASQVSHIPARRGARWTSERRFAFVLSLLEDARLDLLVDPPIPFADAPAAYARLAATPGASIQTVFSYRND
jgi:2-desacetyl-2-hydroxyethyl bacteriochlorophyllide A dehydrogenase